MKRLLNDSANLLHPPVEFKTDWSQSTFGIVCSKPAARIVIENRQRYTDFDKTEPWSQDVALWAMVSFHTSLIEPDIQISRI
jgi:hypothetical protein